MENSPDLLPDDVAALRAELIAARAKIEAELAVAKAKASDDLAVIARQKLRIEKLERQLYGPKAERRVRLIDQMEFQLEELEMAATEDELAAEMAVAATVNVTGFTRSRPVKKPLPEHLARERVVVPGPVSCQCCGGARLQPGSGPFQCHPARMGRPQSSGDDPVRQVRPASPAQSSGRALRTRRRSAQPVDGGR